MAVAASDLTVEKSRLAAGKYSLGSCRCSDASTLSRMSVWAHSPAGRERVVMRSAPLMLAGLFMLLTFAVLAQPADDHASDRAYIQESESAWAKSVATNDVSVLERILADDFVGVDVDGSHYSKANAIADYRKGPSSFVINRLNEVEIRFYGNTAIAQGNESWKKKDGTVGRFVWTDTWIKRDGKWQIVAAEDLVPPPPSTQLAK
jgi:ketosteroid isomerase-like protein